MSNRKLISNRTSYQLQIRIQNFKNANKHAANFHVKIHQQSVKVSLRLQLLMWQLCSAGHHWVTNSLKFAIC